jgi:uncharacterized protein YmfQ (DUF2313 family)
MRCPDHEQMLASVQALTPRGRAWQNSPVVEPGETVQRQFWRALSYPFFLLNQRLCKLVDEFFCETAEETLDTWAQEYGFPDPCDPFADLCAKVDAVGDSTIAYAVAAAAERGWAISIAESWTLRSEVARCGIARTGAAICGAASGVSWTITIRLGSSSAYSSPRYAAPRAGRMRAGQFLSCGPDIEPLRCLIRRIAPAHADLIFTTQS